MLLFRSGPPLPTAASGNSIYIPHHMRKMSSNIGRRCAPPSHSAQSSTSRAGSVPLETLFGDAEQEICAYFEADNSGRLVGGARRRPTSDLELQNVQGRMDAGALRAENSAAAFRDGFDTGHPLEPGRRCRLPLDSARAEKHDIE